MKSSQSTDDCRNVEMTPPISDSALVAHVINKTEVGSLGTCRVMCYIEADCVSLNLVTLQHTEGLLCELSDSDHIQHPEDLLYRPGSTYVSIKVSAGNCNGQRTPFQTVQPQSDKRPFCCRTNAPLISVQRIVAVSQASLQKVTAANAQTGLLVKTAQKVLSSRFLNYAIFLKGYSLLLDMTTSTDMKWNAVYDFMLLF